MGDDVISDELRDFILSFVDSITQLEGLLHPSLGDVWSHHCCDRAEKPPLKVQLRRPAVRDRRPAGAVPLRQLEGRLTTGSTILLP